MGEVVSILQNKPHMTGLVRCQNCKHEWTAVEPAGQYNMKCPACGSYQGVWRNGVRSSRRPTFVCNCGCDTFTIHPDGQSCTYCGADVNPYG